MATARAQTTGRHGNSNARRQAEDTSAPPWSRWKTRSLPARGIRFMETYCRPAKGHGRGQPLKLGRWQKDWLEAAFSGDVTSSALTLPRGNGKSTFGGGIATWCLFDEAVADAFGGQPDIPVVAPVLRQAVKGVYGAALAFTKAEPELMARSIIYSAAGDTRIKVPFNLDGTLYPAAADVDALQGLDPSVVFVDEIGFISIEAWDALLLAGGKRPRSLTLGIGTRSPGNEPNALDHLLLKLELLGEIPGFHLVDYSGDPDCAIGDRRQWRKANPAMVDGYLRESALDQALAMSPEAAFRTFRLNMKTESQSGWLGVDGPTLWHGLRDTSYSFEMGAETWLGIDVSQYHDSTAVVAAQRRPDGRIHTAARIWTPSPGKPIPFAEVTHHISELAQLYRIVSANYDPRLFAAPAQQLEAEGVPMVEVPQSHGRMVPLVGETYRRIIERNVTHNADEAFTAHVLNAVPHLATGGGSGFSLGRKKTKGHIDSAVAMCLAIGSMQLDAVPTREHDDDEILTF